MRRTMIVLALLAAGCVAHRPGVGVTDAVARRWGCDPAEIFVRAESLKQQLSSSQQFIPQVGWTACDLLAHNGAPSEVEQTSTRAGTTYHWWYRDQYELNLIALEQDGSGVLRVVYVDW